MSEMSREELLRIETLGSEQGWVAPLTSEDKEYFAYLRGVFKRYNISPSKATQLEYDFVTRVAESEFYLQQAMTHNLTHTAKGAGGDSGADRTESITFPEQKGPKTAERQRFLGFQSVGKDGETCPCRNNTVKNGEESSAKPGFFLQISTFPAVFNLAFLA